MNSGNAPPSHHEDDGLAQQPGHGGDRILDGKTRTAVRLQEDEIVVRCVPEEPLEDVRQAEVSVLHRGFLEDPVPRPPEQVRQDLPLRRDVAPGAPYERSDYHKAWCRGIAAGGDHEVCLRTSS